MRRQQERSRYFQEIARFFFNLRGAPFVLSSSDQMTIASWEQRRIPFTVVAEGITRAAERYRKRHPGRKMRALSLCDREVMRAFQDYRERKVGRTGKAVSRDEKRKSARAEVERFCRGLPPEWDRIKPIVDQALRLLSRKAVAEEELESLEEKLDEILLREAPESDRVEAKRSVPAEFSALPKAEFERICAIRVVKALRQKLKIPHFPLYYY